MERLAKGIIHHRRIVMALVIALLIASAFFLIGVDINYKLSDYLPESAPSTGSIDVMEEHFAQGIPNLNVLVPDVSIMEALEYKERFLNLEGVYDVMWLDDTVDLKVPIEQQEEETVESWYKDGDALFRVSVETEQVYDNVEAVRQEAKEGSKLSGEAANEAAVQQASTDEISKILMYVIPLVLVVLLITTSSWFEPVLFLVTIGAAILINEGTNIIFGEISYVTQATSAILQLAVSMDYAIFLLHRFLRYREEGQPIEKAMQHAMVSSVSAITASATTTVFGFLALTLMDFRIGVDLGRVLAKGVFISYLSVVILLPILTIYTAKLIDKTHHRSFIPSFDRFAKGVMAICKPLAILLILVILPSFFAQQNNTFIYGSSGMHTEGSQIKEESDAIKEQFGQAQQMAILLPIGDEAREKDFVDELETIEYITSVTAYANTVGTQIPYEFVTDPSVDQLRSEEYSRVIITANTSDEGERAFETVEAIRETADQYYEESYHLVGESVINYDLMDTITADHGKVTFAAIIGIGLVIALTFRSLSLPIILILTIQGAIWINLGLPYIRGMDLNFIGYQIISAVQLGATVDYGILFGETYMQRRTFLEKRESIQQTISETAPSIITPAGILIIAGNALGVISSNGVISQLGMILGRGALISVTMVLLFLPALLLVFDGLIQKTTFSGKKKGTMKNETSE
ncbi:MAG TPA: hypothetical protein DHN33_06870 [Eubacteriaceae bacterium]|nr:hypothetical protein [Eubacteriaceae bacterium]